VLSNGDAVNGHQNTAKVDVYPITNSNSRFVGSGKISAVADAAMLPQFQPDWQVQSSDPAIDCRRKGSRRLHLPVRLELGQYCRIGDGTYFTTADKATIRIGDRVNINLGCVLVAIDGITIGENTSIAEYVSIRDQAHKMDADDGVRGGEYSSAPVTIGKNVWIGRGVYIGAGTVIGDNCVIGANSVVHGEFPPFSLIAGAPATVRKRLPVAPEVTTEVSS
ncbi:MAG: acyltransferase, partial [Pseudomonadota bacterium]